MLLAFTRHTDRVQAVACTTVDGRPVAVTTACDETARVWHLTTGEEHSTFDFRGIGAVVVGV